MSQRWILREDVRSAVRSAVLAGIVLAVRMEADLDRRACYVTGALAMAQHQALAFGLDWIEIVHEARLVLGKDLGALLDVVPMGTIEGGQNVRRD